jgi:DNA-binding transcriptional MerR regulator
MTEKSAGALRTIGELSSEIGLPQHILRYWETRFSQLKPLTRAGSRRYYRPEDVALVRRIHTLLYSDGYTVKAVQKLLGEKAAEIAPQMNAPPVAVNSVAGEGVSIASLRMIRDKLALALDLEP